VGLRPATLTAFVPKRPRPTPVFDTYWRFAAKRQRIFHRRARSEPPPWTDDVILAAHRFTNVYRAADRVSQFLINVVIPEASHDPVDALFRALVFKVFNRIDTWHALESQLGPIHSGSFDAGAFAAALSMERRLGRRVYSGAYIMPMPAAAGATEKHVAHLGLLSQLLRSHMFDRIGEAPTLREVYMLLSMVQSFGPFLAYQFAVDLNYAPMMGHSEMEFVVAGPGARSGITKCFEDLDGLSFEDVIRYTCDRADAEFGKRGLEFENLWGRNMHLIDCQNLFCEVDKYSRVAHPEAIGIAGRTRIKQRYVMDPKAVKYGFPANWGVRVPPYAQWPQQSIFVK